MKVENLLEQALVPVEPPSALGSDLTSRLAAITASAQGELESWELSAMRNPRNWVRPVAAALIGTAAGTALIVIRVRTVHRQRVSDGDAIALREVATRTVRGLARGVGRALPLALAGKPRETEPVAPAKPVVAQLRAARVDLQATGSGTLHTLSTSGASVVQSAAQSVRRLAPAPPTIARVRSEVGNAAARLPLVGHSSHNRQGSTEQ